MWVDQSPGKACSPGTGQEDAHLSPPRFSQLPRNAGRSCPPGLLGAQAPDPDLTRPPRAGWGWPGSEKGPC